MRKLTVFLFACVVFSLCRITSASAVAMYQKEPELPDAKQYILDALAQNKLVLIGDEHYAVNEEIFMAENMQAFYDAGLRYIFIEGNEVDYDASQTPLLLFPPWRTDVGGKYETGVITQAIQKINDAVPEEERIREIPAEVGYNPAVVEEGIDFNKRDQQAFRNISEFMEKLPLHKKAMIFYGGNHGQIKPTTRQIDGGEPFLWTPLGAYLKERYGNNFISMYPLSAKDEMHYVSLDIPELKDIGSKPKIVLSNTKNDIANNNSIHSFLSQYDAVLLDREAMYGIGINYMPTYERLFAMYNGLRDLEDSIDNWKNDVAIFRGQEQGQYLQRIYYLKMWLGDSFDYRLWDTKKPLRDALDELKATIFTRDTPKVLKIESDISVTINVQQIHDYCNVMLMSGVEPIVFDYFEPGEEIFQEIFPWVVDHMKEAIPLLPQDLWAYYWLAYAETELGDYNAAIAHWEYIIAQPLSYCMETLPRVYQKLSVCYAAKGDQNRSDEYKKIGESLVNEHGLIVTNLNDVK